MNDTPAAREHDPGGDPGHGSAHDPQSDSDTKADAGTAPSAAPLLGAPPVSPSGRLLALGCGAGLVVMVLTAGVLYFAWPHVMASLSRGAIAEALGKSQLPEEERERVLATVDRVLEQFVDGKIESFEPVFRAFEASPISRVFLVLSARARYFPKSGLTPEETEAADRSLQRLNRGLMEGKVTQTDLQEHIGALLPKGADGKASFKQDVTDEQLRLVLAKVLELVDERGIPDEPWELHIAEEFERVVDGALMGEK